MRNLSAIFGFARLAAFAAILLAFDHGAALADGERPWTLQETSGQVRLIKSGISPVALTVGDTFSGGNWIETGPDGRAVVRRGDESILVAPNSRIGLPRDNTGPFATRILQTLGTILLKVEKKTRQHFEVQTPYLTAVVKGTTFTVGIQGQRAVVHVIEGLVEVRDLASGQRRTVRPGQTGVVLSDSGSGVFIDDAPAGDAQDGAAASAAGAASKIVIREALGPQTIDVKSTTGGLMREANAAENGTAPDKNSGGTNVAAAGASSNTGVALTADISGLGDGILNVQDGALEPNYANGQVGGLGNTFAYGVGNGNFNTAIPSVGNSNNKGKAKGKN